MPFITAQIESLAAGQSPLSILDAACGTGMHAIALALRGCQAAGADLSPGMIAMAEANARQAGVQVDFRRAGFGELRHSFQHFDGLLCLGNSLPHLLTPAELSGALQDFAACLRPGGLLLVQNRNFDAVLASRERWMSPEAHRDGEQEWLFLRFYDFQPDSLIDFHVITLHRAGDSAWTQKVDSTRLRPLREAELVAALEAAGFTQVTRYGSMSGEAFDPAHSPNLVLRALKTAA
jgi:SAM-dependent methyltransferase